MLSLVLSVPVLAPNARAEKTGQTRKIIAQVEPVYPADLKRARIGGTVRLDIVVSPRGSVDFVQIVGGNPILVDAAVKAVKQWKYAPTSSTTNLRINLNFDPNR